MDKAQLEERVTELEAELKVMTHRADEYLERWRKARARYPNGAEGCCCLFDEDNNQIDWCAVHAELRDERDGLKEDNERLREALNRIASWREGPRVTSSFDEPGSAEIARQALGRE